MNKSSLKLPALDPQTVKPLVGSDYPPPHDKGPAKRERRRIGDAVGLRISAST